MKIKLLTLVLALLASSMPLASASSTLFDISTATTSGVGANLYEAGAVAGVWGGSTVVVSPGHIVETVGTATSGAFGFAVAKFTTTSLAIGDKITVNYTFTMNNYPANAQGLRFGLYNIGVATTGADALGTGSNSYGGATGYRTDYGVNMADATSGIRESITTTTYANLFATSAASVVAYTPASTAAFNVTYTTGSQHTGLLSLERTSTGVLVTTQMDTLATVTFTDTTSPFTDFNAFGFWAQSNGSVGSMDLTNLNISYTTVPEPQMISLVIAASFVLAVFHRRSEQ